MFTLLINKATPPMCQFFALGINYASELGSSGTIWSKSPMSIWILRRRIVKWQLWKPNLQCLAFVWVGGFLPWGLLS